MSKKGILCTGISLVGFGATIALVVHETPNYLEAKKNLKDPKLGDKLKLIGKHYYPALITGVATVGSITANCVIEQKTQASLIAMSGTGYGLYKRYANEVKEKLGIDTHQKVIDSIAEKETKKLGNVDIPEGYKLYWNEYIGHILARPEKIEAARYELNHTMYNPKWKPKYFFSFQDFLDLAEAKDYDEDPSYASIGWDYYVLSDKYDSESMPWIDIEIGKTRVIDGIEYTEIIFNDEPIGTDTDDQQLFDAVERVLDKPNAYPREDD